MLFSRLLIVVYLVAQGMYLLSDSTCQPTLIETAPLKGLWFRGAVLKLLPSALGLVYRVAGVVGNYEALGWALDLIRAQLTRHKSLQGVAILWLLCGILGPWDPWSVI